MLRQHPTAVSATCGVPGNTDGCCCNAQAELARFDGSPDDVEIFFSAHGVPESYVEQAGDPYKEEMEQCIGFIMAELRVRLLDPDADPRP